MVMRTLKQEGKVAGKHSRVKKKMHNADHLPSQASDFTIFNLFQICLSFYKNGYFLCICVCVPPLYLVPVMVKREHQIPWDQCCEQPWNSNLGTIAGQQVFLKAEFPLYSWALDIKSHVHYLISSHTTRVMELSE